MVSVNHRAVIEKPLGVSEVEVAEAAETYVSIAVPAEVYPYSAGLVGGVLGGLAMAAVAVVTGLIMGIGPWYPLNLVAAAVMRPLQTASSEVLSQFNPAALGIGFVLHMLLSLGIGGLFALLLPTLPGRPWLWSAVIGPALWLVAQFAVLPALNPLMSAVVWQPSFLAAHVVYGLVLGSWIQNVGKVPVASAKRGITA
jgi:hypothetical protein